MGSKYSKMQTVQERWGRKGRKEWQYWLQTILQCWRVDSFELSVLELNNRYDYVAESILEDQNQWEVY